MSSLFCFFFKRLHSEPFISLDLLLLFLFLFKLQGDADWRANQRTKVEREKSQLRYELSLEQAASIRADVTRVRTLLTSFFEAV